MIEKHFWCLLENAGCIPLAVVIMTIANGMQPTFSGRHTKCFDHFLSILIFTDFSRRLSMTIRLMLPSTRFNGMYFGKFSDNSLMIGNDKKYFGRLPENVGCIPLAIVIMTTANGMHPTFFRNTFEVCCHIRSLPSCHGVCRSAYRHRTKLFSISLDTCYFKIVIFKKLLWTIH